MFSIPGKSPVSITPAAERQIARLMAAQSASGLRIGLKKGGCAGMEYTMDFVENADPADDMVEEKGATLFIDPKAILFLLGATMDYRVDKLSSGFVFDNPNQTGACGCGESVAITPADQAQLEAFDKPIRVS